MYETKAKQRDGSFVSFFRDASEILHNRQNIGRII